MSHTLTETATFDPTIVVPDGGDSGANRAGDVELIAQRLANRSRALKAVTDQAAVKNAANSFAQPNTFTNGLTANAVTITATLDVTGNADVLGGDFRVLNGHNLIATGNVGIESTHELLYVGTVATLHKHISLAKGSGNVQAGVTNVRMQLAVPVLENFAAAADGVWFVPIELPGGSQLTVAEFQCNDGSSGGAFTFTIVRQVISDWAAVPSGSPTYPAIGVGAVGSIAGVQTVSVGLANYPIDNLAEAYYARIIFNNGYTGGSVWGFRLGFTNYGLNNR